METISGIRRVDDELWFIELLRTLGEEDRWVIHQFPLRQGLMALTSPVGGPFHGVPEETILGGINDLTLSTDLKTAVPHLDKLIFVRRQLRLGNMSS